MFEVDHSRVSRLEADEWQGPDAPAKCAFTKVLVEHQIIHGA